MRPISRDSWTRGPGMTEHLFDPAPYTLAESEPGAPCIDCGMATAPEVGSWEYYMVLDSVWQAAGMGRGFLCIGCLEHRLDRRLEREDFPDLLANEPDAWDSPRLRARKERSAS